MATGGGVPWAAVAMVVVGLLVAVGGLAILTGRGRGSSNSSQAPAVPDAPAPDPVFTAHTPPREMSGTKPDGEPSTPEPPTPPVTPEEMEHTVPAADTEETTPVPGTRRVDPSTSEGSGPCDWELRVDLADGAPVVVRAAAGRACCVHVLSLRSLDAAPVATDREERSWSGERTRIGPSRAVSDVRVDRRRVHPEVRGLDLSLEAALTRAVHSPVITIAEDAARDRLIPPTAEELWTTHLARLRDAAVTSETGEVPSRLQTATMHRTEVAVRTTRHCAGAGHRLDAHARVTVRVEGEATPVTGSRLSLPSVAGWIGGDLEAAAINPIEVSSDTDVHPAPGTGAASGLALDTAPGSGLLRGHFAGEASTHVLDDGIRLVAACAVVADLGLDGGSTHAAEGRLTVDVSHDVHMAVSPHAERAVGDRPGGAHLGCACTPEYEVQFGRPPEASDQAAPHARLHVDGRVFRLDAVAGPSAGAMPSWTVGPDAGEADLRQGSTG